MATGKTWLKKGSIHFLGIVLLAAATADCRRSPGEGRRGARALPGDQRSVILVGWDGARRDRMQKLLAQGRLPNLQRLIGEGGWAPTRVITGNTQTKPGWAEILTGYSAVRLGIVSNKEYRPIPAGASIFERLKAHFGRDGIATVFLGGKTNNIGDRGPHRIALNALSRDPDTRAPTHYQGKDFTGLTEDGKPPVWVDREGDPFHFSRGGVDEFRIGLGPAPQVARTAAAALTRLRGRRFFAFVHFMEPDEPGHLHGEASPQYEEGMCAADAQLGVLMKTLGDLGIYNQTVLYVTTDHGFDKGGFAHTAAPETFLATNSRRRLRSGDRKDVTPTLLEELGVDVGPFSPPLDGKSLLLPRLDAATAKPLRIGYFLGGRTNILTRMLHAGDFDQHGLYVELWTRGLRDDRYHPLDISGLVVDAEEGKATGSQLIDGMLGGRWELSTPGESSFLAEAAAGKPIVAVASLGHDVQGDSGHLFALRKGLRLGAPADYLGKLFVSRRAGPGDIAFLLEYLVQQGVDLGRDALVLPRVPRSVEERRSLPKDKVLLVYNVMEDDLTEGVSQGVVDGGFFHLKPFESMSRRLQVVRPLHDWVNPELSAALLVCSRDILKDPANRRRLKALLSAYLKRIRYERSLSEVERRSAHKDRWRAMESATPGLNYPQYPAFPLVDEKALLQMADLLAKHRLVSWKKPGLRDHIDDSLLREAAAELRREP